MRTTALSVLATLSLCAATLAVAAAPAQAASPRVTLAGSAPGWATQTRRLRSEAGSDRLQFRVYLSLRNRAALDATATAVSNPRSASYRHYLSPAQMKAAFDPSDASVATVSSWLEGEGLHPNAVPANNLYVQATGTVAQVSKAFGVNLGVYGYQGHHLRAPDRALSIPAALGSVVSGVVGVDQSENLLHPNHVVADATPNAPGGFRNARPCSAYWGQQVDTTDPAYGGGFPDPLPYATCGYTPPQLRSAYGLAPVVAGGDAGQGVTVAIVDAYAAPSIFKDASRYAKINDPAHPFQSSQFSQIVFRQTPKLAGPDFCDAEGWYGEETLDVEAVHAMAPAANILYVGGSDCLDTGLDVALNTVVANGLAQIVSNSYGDLGEDVPSDVVAAFDAIAESAVTQGIGVYFSSGDDGDEVSTLGGPPTPDFSATSPWVTAVGGTSTGIDQNGNRVLETGWETGESFRMGTAAHRHWSPAAPGAFIYGSGGGTSRLYAEPGYQAGVVPDALAEQNQSTPGAKGRVVPDISMDGDPTTGMLVGETQVFPDGRYYDQYRIGGTSLSSPLFAGLMAVADQVTGVRHGFVNPALYGNEAGTDGIIDVQHVVAAAVRVDYNNGVDASNGVFQTVRSFDFTGLAIHTTPGYDDTTGLGTPNGLAFIDHL
jgi:subtilase family serine protease